MIRSIKQQHYEQIIEEKEVAWMSGVLPFLDTLRTHNKLVVIVTNSPRRHLMAISKQLPELLKISPWVTRDDVKETKPSPLPYLKAMHLVNIPASRTVGFEDSEKGLQSLVHAGIHPILINSSPPEINLEKTLFQHYPSFDALSRHS